MSEIQQSIRRRALRLEQDPSHPLYMFSLTGGELLRIAEVSRISRDDAGKLIGYQRPEVRKHVQDIVEYLNSEQVLFPNSVILALTSRVRFTRIRGPQVGDEDTVAGTLEIPVSHNGDAKPAWIVDGQQRVLALSKSKRSDLVVPVNAFVADEVSLQRDQFLRINNTRPLPRGLITELLPEVSTSLPAKMAARRIPAAVCEWLSSDKHSPFFGLIRRTSMRGHDEGKAVIADASIVKMIEESLSSATGCLYPYRNLATGQTDFDSISAVLVTYWKAVRNVFPDAWGKTPEKSRLMHGVGIRAMGRLMDKVMPAINARAQKAISQTEKELRLIVPICRWTSGAWEQMGGVKWNEVENLHRHIQMVSWVLIHAYHQAKGRA